MNNAARNNELHNSNHYTAIFPDIMNNCNARLIGDCQVALDKWIT